DQPLLRKAMSLAIDYDEFKVLLQALGRPGCPSIPPQWMDRTPCYSLDLNEAKKILSKIPQELLQKSFKLKVSQMGGLDIKKQAEFLQSQWRKNLGLNIEIDQVEQKAYLNELRSKTPDIFRKGVGIDRPTCLSALETFASDGQQNYMKIKVRKYDELLNQLAIANDKTKKKSLCRQGVEYLMNKNLIIPLGEIHFSILAQPKYEGWSINSLNQLDLSQLHPIQ
ncbi:MAG: peptide ABC transporter substrate-binding protein, partial [Bdellovibrionales bacterium]|nr:peptide ABC transporter substrate-binding protein [Bdellovibrionales bacterium]